MEQNVIERFDMRVAHVGINADNAEQGKEWAETFLQLFGLQTRETPASYFTGELVEIVKQNGRGQRGHIGFHVNDCEQAMKYFEERGVRFLPETKKCREDGTCYFVYMEQQIGGFAIHLTEG